MKNPPVFGGFGLYFCHVRFLWRLDFKRFRRLCLFILSRRFFLRFPMGFRRTKVLPGSRAVESNLPLGNTP